jgi:hypothetical protein
MLNKRGQITIFVIIAVLILAIVGIYYITSNKGINQDPITAETAPIYDGVYKCIEDTAIDALYYIGLTGGYYFSPILSDENGVAFYYYEGENFMLSKEQLAEEISLTIDNTLHFCTNEVLNITEFNITKGNITTNIEIGENKISINVEYPLTISKEDSNSILKNWEGIEIETQIGTIYNSIEQITLDQMTREDLCLSCIADIAEENSLKIDLTSSDHATILFVVTDEEFGLNGFDYEFSFVNKYLE